MNVCHFAPSNFTKAMAFGILLVCLGCAPAVMARGGFHGGSRLGFGAGGLPAPAYVLITVSAISDAQAFKTAMADVSAAVTPFSGRLVADADKPVPLEGKAPDHVAMIQFDNSEQAEAWKKSDAFKSFDTELRRISEPTMQLMPGMPTAVARGGGRGGRGRFDQKAYEANVKDYDQVLSKMHSICKGC